MPGGISRLLRTTPVLVDIARDVLDLAPDAHFFNYSNPMTANVMAMSSYAGADHVVGLCHGMHHVQHHLAAFIDKPFEETSTLYAGINHLTFIYDFRWNGQDAWPLVREKVDRELAQAPDPDDLGDIFSDVDQGVEQPVLVGDLPPLRGLSGGRGPARHRVLPAAVGRRRLLRQEARGRCLLGG